MPPATFEDRSRRHGARPLAVGCLGIFGALLVAAIGYLAWSNQLPPPEPDTRPMPNPNGYDACLAAFAKLQQATAIRPLPDRETADLPTIRAAATAYRPSLDAVRAAMKLPFETPPVARGNGPMPEMIQFRNACRAFGLESRLAREEGRPGEAIQRSLDAVDLGVRMKRGGSFLIALVGQACTAIGVRSAEDVVPQLSAREARAAGARLDRIIQLLPSAASVMEGERRYTLLATREILTGQSPIATSATAFSGGTPSQWDLLKERAVLFVYPKRWGYQRTDQYSRELIGELRKPYPARQEPVSQLPDNDPVLGGSMGAPDFSFHLARHEQYLRMLRAQLALQEARQARGHYPALLRDLIPEILRDVPADPFDGQPLRYHPKGDGYLLYSVGPDLKDDGGRPIDPRNLGPAATGDIVAGQQWPQRTPKLPSR